MAETPSIGNRAQADENLRKNSRSNYELAALPAELLRRIWPRKIAAKQGFGEPFAAALRSSVGGRLPAAHLPTELVVARGGRGDVKSLAHHRR
jgi:hypothetical protein